MESKTISLWDELKARAEKCGLELENEYFNFKLGGSRYKRFNTLKEVKDFLDGYEAKTCTPNPVEEVERRTGRTTARMLKVLADACMSPGTTVEFVDHIPHTLHSARIYAGLLYEKAIALEVPVSAVTLDGNRVFVTVRKV